METDIPKHKVAWVAAAVLGIAAAALPAGPAHAATWSTTTTPSVTSGTNVLNGIDARSTTDAWAVGHVDHSPNPPLTRPLAMRWNGSGWAAVSTPTISGGGSLRGVDGSSSTDVWAVGTGALAANGGSTAGRTLTERWNGSAWSVVASPNPAGATTAALEGVKSFSTTSAWAVGSYGAPTAPFSRTLIERWNGTAWTVVPSPNPDPNFNLLSDVDGAAVNDVWAIGNVGKDGYGSTVAGIVLHWNGTAWSQVAVPGSTSGGTLRTPVLQDVTVVSANDVWIVGQAFHFGLFRTVPIFMHWNGSTWQSGFVPTSTSGGFTAVTALSATKVYAVGAVVARWNGSAWVVENFAVPGSPADAASAGTGTVWAAGHRYNPALGQNSAMVFRTTNG